jgi:hypothetical protein
MIRAGAERFLSGLARNARESHPLTSNDGNRGRLRNARPGGLSTVTVADDFVDAKCWAQSPALPERRPVEETPFVWHSEAR